MPPAPTAHAPRRTAVALAAAGLGAMLLLGGIGELAGLLVFSGAGEVGEALSALHVHPAVKAVVAVQGVVSLAVGAVLLQAAAPLRRGEAPAAQRARSACFALLAMFAASQLVLALTLYPQLWREPLDEPFPGFWLMSLVTAPIGPGGVALAIAVLGPRWSVLRG